MWPVNEILGNHNIDKQLTDSRGEVAYLMADISSVNSDEIKDIVQDLEMLPGGYLVASQAVFFLTTSSLHSNEGIVLGARILIPRKVALFRLGASTRWRARGHGHYSTAVGSMGTGLEKALVWLKQEFYL